MFIAARMPNMIGFFVPPMNKTRGKCCIRLSFDMYTRHFNGVIVITCIMQDAAKNVNITAENELCQLHRLAQILATITNSKLIKMLLLSLKKKSE